MCNGCGEMKPKRELIRIVRSPEGNISLDLSGKASGRGAYVCKSAECFERLKKRKGLNRAFGCEVDAAVYENLQNQIADECGDSQ